MQRNKYFYRGVVKLVTGAIIAGLGMAAVNHVYNTNYDSTWMVGAFILTVVGVMTVSQGIYFMIPFRYGSTWNGEMRWKNTVFENVLTFILLLTIIFFITPYDFVAKSIWVPITLLLVIVIMLLSGYTVAKRSHGPVRESLLDRALAKMNIY